MVVSLVLGVYAAARRPPQPRPAPPRPVVAEAPQGALQHVGVVRFNPYRDTGGDYSFSVALLDENGTGLLLTGLYHRDQTRVYTKEVRGWVSDQELMGEEREAIEKARG